MQARRPCAPARDRSDHARAQIADGLVERLAPIEANEVFLRLPPAVQDGLERDGFRFFRRPGDVARFVCRFDSRLEDAEALVQSLKRQRG